MSAEDQKVLVQFQGFLLEGPHTDELGHHVVTARLTDMTTPEKPDEVADIYLSSFDPSDWDLLVEGAYMVWDVGDGWSKLKINRECWTEDELADAAREAERLRVALNWGLGNEP
jgi:hypothetical protein